MTDNGIGKSADISSSKTLTIACFIAIALYNVAELNFITFGTFKTRQNLYFWSFLISTWGIAVYSIGFLLKDLQLSSQSVMFVTLIIVGWCCMVTGQSVVLYSRLHLIVRDQNILRLVLAMIIFNAVICHVPIAVMVSGANSNNPGPFLMPYSIYEKVQVTIFFIQELTISGLYIVQTVKILRPEGNIRRKASRKVMTHLIYVNAIIVVLDITILGLEYSGLYDIQTAYKALVYSLKLKLEFSILNQLVGLTKSGHSGGVIYDHSHSNTERGVMHLETFDGTRRDRQDQQDHGPGYSAFVHPGTGDDRNGRGQDPNKDGVVVLTTDIVVQSDSRLENRNRRGSGIDSESIGARSGATGISVEDGKEHDAGNRTLSKSSSEIQLAASGF